jgi:hypothetical protein
VPITPSHAAAVLPLFRTGLVPSALVVGSMAPDVPYFVPLPASRGLSHSLTGIVTVDVVLGLVVFAVWQAVVAAGVVAIAPSGLGRRLGPDQPAGLRRHFGSARAAGLVVMSLVVGGVTHVAWDAFTHPDEWGTRHVAVLRESFGPLPLFKWAQYGSGVFGAAVLAGAAIRWWRATPPIPASGAHPAAERRLAIGAWAAVVLAAAGVAALSAVGPLTAEAGADYHDAAYLGVTRGGAAGGVALVAFAGAWAVRSRAASAGGGHGRGA